MRAPTDNDSDVEDVMITCRTPLVLGLGAVAVVAVAVTLAQTSRPATFADVAGHDFSTGPLVAWGDRDTGPYGAFSRFDPGFTTELHVHTNDIHVVGIRGAYIYRPQTGPERRVGPGQFLIVPGGVPHVSAADPVEGALFYETSTRGFDSRDVAR
jgi:hypothetical protein